ncbi:MAG TPA: serine/threonine-protein kinase [Isosphaeraceae bacterium]|nr:serine/threonine-protein kinase [Isosphaeraceae bacterium]
MKDTHPNHHETLSAAVVRGMDHVCDCFEAAWMAGLRPKVEDYLSDLMPDPYRSILLRKLLERELACRRQVGEEPTAEEYRARYPGQSAIMRAIFGEEPPASPSSSGLMPVALLDSGPGELALSYVVTRPDGQIGPLLSPEGHAKILTRFAPGRVLQGRYVLERELGRGGMGQVHLAHDRRMERSVAIKVVIPPKKGAISDPAGDQIQNDLAEEARLGADLRHWAITLVFDHAMDDNFPYTVFEYIDGPSLRDQLHRWGRLPLGEVRRIVGQLAQGLDFAHERSVIHRDLKPENIRLKDQSQYVLLDFGLVKDFRRRADLRAFAGTPAYAAPEQAAGPPSDGRSDQYSLALIAYEMITGRRAFAGAEVKSLLEMHRTKEPISPRKVVPDLPRRVMTALWRALHKEPALRFDTCSAFARAMGCQLPQWPGRLRHA